MKTTKKAPERLIGFYEGQEQINKNAIALREKLEKKYSC